ncbi:MAG: hypothetical protein ABIG10_02460 [bacterium]
MSTNYVVITEKYAERHYIKKFQKKYKSFWDKTWQGIIEELKRLDALLETGIADEIVCINDISICKTEFRIAGTKYSRKKSGNRCIIAAHKKIREIKILLVYHKDDIGGNNETATWKKIIRENYIDYTFCK